MPARPSSPSRRKLSGLAAAAAALCFAACQKQQIQSYQVPKENEDAAATAPAPLSDAAGGAAAPQMPGGDMSGSVPTASGPSLVWSAPSDWTAFPPGQMAKANWHIAGSAGQAEVAIYAFPGSVGGELANVNRWRGQAGLPPLSDADLASAVDHVSASGLDIVVVDANGPTEHLLGAIVPFGDSTWFVKLTGPAALVARTKPEFLRFLGTLAPSGGALAQAPAAGAAPDAGSGAMTGSVPVASGPGLAWSAPAGWDDVAPGPMAKATYRIAGPEGTAELAAYAFPGDVGGELANVNRWRGQAGLPPLGEGELGGALTRIAAGGLSIDVVDVDGPTSHLLGAIVPFGGSTWFFKLTGPSALVAREKAAFLAFLRTLRPSASA